MHLKDLPPSMQFIFIGMMRSAILMKEKECDEEFFVKFAREVWVSMEMNGLEKMKHIIDGAMKKDIEIYVEKYMKTRGKNVG